MVQVFYPELGANWIIGVVGQLQLEVLVSRLEAEYKVDAYLEMAPFETARWISGDEATVDGLSTNNQRSVAKDLSLRHNARRRPLY